MNVRLNRNNVEFGDGTSLRVRLKNRLRMMVAIIKFTKPAFVVVGWGILAIAGGLIAYWVLWLWLAIS